MRITPETGRKRANTMWARSSPCVRMPTQAVVRLNAAPKHDDRYQYSSALHEYSTHNGAGPVPDIRGQDHLSGGQELSSDRVGGRARVLIAERDHRECRGRREHECHASENDGRGENSLHEVNSPKSCKQAQEQDVVERQHKDGGQIEAQEPHAPVPLQQSECLSGGRGRSAQDQELDDRRQRVGDQNEGSDSSCPIQTTPIACRIPSRLQGDHVQRLSGLPDARS